MKMTLSYVILGESWQYNSIDKGNIEELKDQMQMVDKAT